MDCWEILGIPNSTSVEQLQITYYNKLRHYSATGNEDECSELKKAYEEALDSIKNNQGERFISRFILEVDNLYKNFAERIVLENWIKILNKYNTESKLSPELNKALLKYLQTHQHLPYKVWEYLNHEFKWNYYRNELYIEFPKNFINFILRYSKKELYIRYDKFPLSDIGINYDGFISEIINTTDALAKRDLKLVQKHMNSAKSIYSDHIDLKILFIKYKKLKNELDRCIELCDFILSSDDKSKIVYSIRGDCFLKKNDLQRAYNDFISVMNIEPISNEDYYNLSFVCFLLKKPIDAKRYIECIKEDDLYLTLKKDLSKDINNLIKDSELPKVIQDINEEPTNLNLYRQAFEIYYNTESYYEIYALLNNLKDLKPLDVDLYFKLGKVCFKLDKLDESLLALYETINYDPGNSEALELLGDILVKLFKCEEALVMYNKVLDLKPDDSAVLMKVSEVLFTLGKYKESMEHCNNIDNKNMKNNYCNSEKLDNLIVSLLIELRSYEAALDKCQVILNINQNSMEACLNKVKIYNKLEKYDETMDFLNSISSIVSVDYGFLNQKAQTLYYLGEIDESEKICKDLISAKYDSFEPEYILGLIHSNKNEYKISSQYYCSALKKKNVNDTLLLAIGRNYKNLGDDDKALEFINKAIEENDLSVEAYIERINLYMDNEQYEDALSDVEKSIKIKESPELYFKFGEILENLNENPIIHYNKAIDMDGDYSYAYLNRGIYYSKIGKYINAFEDFDKVIKIDNKLPLSYLQRGNIYLKAGKSSEAIEEYNKAVDLGYDDFGIYIKLGECYRAINNYNKSIDNCNIAIKKEPNIIETYRIRGLSLYNTSDYKGALSDFYVCIDANQLSNTEKAGIYKYIAYCYLQLNELIKSRRSFKDAIDLDPNNVQLKEEYDQFIKQNSGIGKLKSVFSRKK